MKNLRTGTAKFDTIRAKDANGLSIQDDGGNGLFIKDGGNVGIGTTNPGAKLDVRGSINLRSGYNVSWDGGNYISANSTNMQFGFTDTKMTIKSDGNVGIGTTNPDNKLHIVQGILTGSSTNSNTSVTIEDATNTGIQFLSEFQTQLRFGDADSDGAGSIIYQHAEDLLRLNTTGAIALQGGNVGIGTTDPLTKIYVGTSAGVYSSTQGINEGLTIDDPNQSSLNLYHGGAGSALSRIVGIKTASGSTDLAFITQNTVLGSQAGRQEWMRITSVGNVGIGNTSPSHDLTLGSPTSTGTTYERLKIYRGADDPGQNLEMGFNHITVTRDANVLADPQSNFSIKQRGSDGERIAVYVDTSGNVGIGTTNPIGKLAVMGDNADIFLQQSDGTISAQIVSDSSGNGKVTANNSAGNPICHLDSNGVSYINGGNVGIGTRNPGGELHIHGDNSSDPKLIIDSGSAGYASSISFTADSERAKITGGYDTGGGGYITFNTDSAGGTSVDRMRINNAGSVAIYSLAASADVVTNASRQLTTSSDKRLKNDLGDCEYGLNEILQVYPKKYTWKEGSEDQQPTVGFFAQDIHPIMPEAAPREAIQNENGEDDYKWGLNSQTIIAALVNATKEQQAIIEELKSQNASLESRISALES